MACFCGLCMPNMIITKANAKEHLGEFICLFSLRKRKRNKISRFSFVIVSLRMVIVSTEWYGNWFEELLAKIEELFNKIDEDLNRHITKEEAFHSISGSSGSSSPCCNSRPRSSSPGSSCCCPQRIRDTPSTAGNSMTSSERPSPEPLWKKRRPQPYWGGENSGNALEASNALNCRVWGIPAVLSRGIPGNALRAFPGSFRSFSGISSGKSQPYWGCGPKDPAVLKILWRINSLSPY